MIEWNLEIRQINSSHVGYILDSDWLSSILAPITTLLLLLRIKKQRNTTI